MDFIRRFYSNIYISTKGVSEFVSRFSKFEVFCSVILVFYLLSSSSEFHIEIKVTVTVDLSNKVPLGLANCQPITRELLLISRNDPKQNKPLSAFCNGECCVPS